MSNFDVKFGRPPPTAEALSPWIGAVQFVTLVLVGYVSHAPFLGHVVHGRYEPSLVLNVLVSFGVTLATLLLAVRSNTGAQNATETV